MKKIIFGVVTYILENLRLPTISAILNKISNNNSSIITINLKYFPKAKLI